MKIFCPYCSQEVEIPESPRIQHDLRCPVCGNFFCSAGGLVFRYGIPLSSGNAEKAKFGCPYCGQHYDLAFRPMNNLLGCVECRNFLLDKKNQISYDDGTTGRRNLYKQTFWPDKQENLLDWDEKVPESQMAQIREGLRKSDQSDLSDWSDSSVFTDASGEQLYQQLVTLLGSPKAASEFLYRAGIDGITYIGVDSGVRNYVAFSDKDIRVDKHIRFSVGNDRPYYQVPFAESVDKVIKGTYTQGGLVFVCPTSAALKGVGIPALPIMMTQQHIRDIYNNTASNGRNAHGMGERLKLLPDMLQKPVAILAASGNFRDARCIVIAQHTDINGNRTLIPIIIGTDTEADGRLRITANIAASAYGKNFAEQMLKNAIDAEKAGDIAVFGANKKITSKLPMPGTPIVPGGGFNVIHNINDKGSPVKGKFKNKRKLCNSIDDSGIRRRWITKTTRCWCIGGMMMNILQHIAVRGEDIRQKNS